MKHATFIREVVDWKGEAYLYKLEPGGDCPHEYVVVSATDVVLGIAAGPETYIFAADSNGEVTDWMELPGSFKGALDHVGALARAGYSLK